MVDIYKNQAEAAGLEPDSRFSFACQPKLDCFNRCCQSPTIILKPYDIIRLRRRLGLTSTEFLESYTTMVREDKSRLPLVMLDIDRDEGSGCPFLEPAGCGVYEDRPGACRLFPVIQGSTLGADGVVDGYFCKRLEYCQGFANGREWTLARWITDQGLTPYDEWQREWLEIILKRGAMKWAGDDARAAALFSMVAYDLDKFRRHVFQTPFLKIFDIPQDVAALVQKSDVELLRFGYKYLKLALLIADAAQMKAEMRELPPPPAPALAKFYF